MMIFCFDTPSKANVTQTILRPSKNGFQCTPCLTLSAVRKVSFNLKQPICVLATFLRIMTVHRNWWKCHKRPLTNSIISNVSWQWYFSFDNPLKSKSGLDHFEIFKKWISVDAILDFQWPRLPHGVITISLISIIGVTLLFSSWIGIRIIRFFL